MFIFRSFTLNTVNILYENLFSSRFFFKYKNQQAQISDKKLQKLGIPLPPTKPSNPFIKFLQMHRPRIVEKEPNISFAKLMKILSQEWKDFDPEKKKFLQDECKLLMENYFLEFKNYSQSLTSEQYRIIKDLQKGKKKFKNFQERIEKSIKGGYPKKPCTSFFLFLIEKQSQKNNDMTQYEWIQHLSKEWKNLPELNKEKYRKQCKLAFDQYKYNKIMLNENISEKNHDATIDH